MPAAARAELVIDLRGGTFQPLPIAIADFGGEGGVLVSGVISNNLKRCGYFAPIDKARHPDKNPPFDAVPEFGSWKAAGVQALVTGRVSRDGSGRIRAEFRLWDVTTGTQTDGQQYFTDPNNARRVGHIISDAIYTKITGVGGFLSIPVWSSSTNPARRRTAASAWRSWIRTGECPLPHRRFRLGGDAALFAGVAGGDLLSQRLGEQPRVHVLNIETGQRQIVGNFPDMTSSPRFAPSGGRIALSLQQGGNANLYCHRHRLAHDDAADPRPGDRHLALLFAGRHADRLRE